MKIKTFLKYFIVIALSFSMGNLIGARYGGIGYLLSGNKEYQYLGSVGDREITAHRFTTEPEVKNFALQINGDFIYWESDTNSDGKIDNIMHFENGIVIYDSQDTNFDGILDRRMVESYNKDRTQYISMVDLDADNEFDMQIIRLNKDSAIIDIEIFINNKWIKCVKEKGQNGIYSAEGNFLPVKFENSQWIVLQTKE